MKIIHKTLTVFTVLLAALIVFSCTLNNYSFAAKPTIPTDLKSIAVTDTSITLSWDYSASSNVKSYYIYMNNTYLISTNTTTYTVTDLNPSTAYNFYIKAVDTRGKISKSSDVITVTTSSSTSLANQALSKKVVGYYAAWSSYSGYTPDKIDVSKLTHINYAFANISSDLKISLGYPDIDPYNFQLLNEQKKINPNLKILISVGGWTWSDKFSDAAFSETSRTNFANSCIDFITTYGLDGIDIDWEYPVSGGLPTNVNRPEDKHNFTLLLKEIREKLDERETIDQKDYLLTIAGSAYSSAINNMELSLIHEYLDYAMIMTYDIHGTWDSYTDFNSPLYTNNDDSPQYKWSVDSSVNAWLSTSFPKDKLIIGIPFYGYIYSSVNNINNGLYQTFSGANSIGYNTILTKYLNTPGFSKYFHSQSMVPWLFNGSIFITYDDPQSIKIKANYIKEKDLGGAMIWELSQDSNNILLNALSEGLK